MIKLVIWRFLPVLLIASAVAGCAQPPPVIPQTTINADQNEVRCRAVGKTARRDARPVPYSIETLALGLPVVVTCEREGFQPSIETIEPLPKPPLATALAGGARLAPMADTVPPPLVPADSPVPAGITVPMRPLLFTSPGARDRYFERLRQQREERWRAFAERLDTECGPYFAPPLGTAKPDADTCRAAREVLAQQRADDLRRLEVERRRATFQ
jgi:hypothetical protein